MVLVHGSKGFEICEFISKAACIDETGFNIIFIGGFISYAGIYDSMWVCVRYGCDDLAYVVGGVSGRSAFFDLNKNT